MVSTVIPESMSRRRLVGVTPDAGRPGSSMMSCCGGLAEISCTIGLTFCIPSVNRMTCRGGAAGFGGRVFRDSMERCRAPLIAVRLVGDFERTSATMALILEGVSAGNVSLLIWNWLTAVLK